MTTTLSIISRTGVGGSTGDTNYTFAVYDYSKKILRKIKCTINVKLASIGKNYISSIPNRLQHIWITHRKNLHPLFSEERP